MTADTATHEDFEKWARKERPHWDLWVRPAHEPDAGDYGVDFVAAAWAAWKARAALPARAPEGRDESAQMQSDIDVLLAIIDFLAEVTGEGPEGEDAALVEQIRKDHERRAAMLSAAPPLPEQDGEEVLWVGQSMGDAAGNHWIGAPVRVVRPAAEPLASPAPGPAEPVVRALEWAPVEWARGALVAECAVGRYEISRSFDDFVAALHSADMHHIGEGTANALKAAAQADYERRILSALQPPPPAPAPVAAQPQPSAEPVAWQHRYIKPDGKIDAWMPGHAFKEIPYLYTDCAVEERPLYAAPPPASDERVAAMRERCAALADKLAAQNFEREKAEAKKAAKARRLGDVFGHGEMAEQFAQELAAAGHEAEALAEMIRALPLDGEG